MKMGWNVKTVFGCLLSGWKWWVAATVTKRYFPECIYTFKKSHLVRSLQVFPFFHSLIILKDERFRIAKYIRRNLFWPKKRHKQWMKWSMQYHQVKKLVVIVAWVARDNLPVEVVPSSESPNGLLWSYFLCYSVVCSWKSRLNFTGVQIYGSNWRFWIKILP